MKSNLRNALRRKLRAKRRHQASHQRLVLETLESRRMLATFADALTADVGYETAAEGEGGAPFVDGELIVRFKPSTSPGVRDAVLDQQGATVIRYFPGVNAYHVQLSGDIAVLDGVDSFSDNIHVATAEPNFTYELDRLIPNDPLFGFQWDKENTGFNGFVADADIDAPEAWGDFGTGDPSVVIAILDSGVDYSHPDLFTNMWQNTGEIPGNFIDDDGNGYTDDVFGIDPFDGDTDPFDEDGHGTHVAGIAGAVGNNGIGVAGVNWNAKLMALRICDTTCTTTGAVQALEYVVNQKIQYGVNVVATNNSWGGLGASQFLLDAFQLAENADIITAASAGNGGQDGIGDNNDAIPHYPSDYPLGSIIGVAASMSDDVLGGFSNYGVNAVDLAAPGVGILSTLPASNYDFQDGTSMSSPQVAGAAALIRSTAPELDWSETRDFILRGVDVKTQLIGLVGTGGRLNINNSLKLLDAIRVDGRVWLDNDGGGDQDTNENGLANWTVYLDANNNQQLDGNESFTLSDANGDYFLESFVGPGQYVVRAVAQPRFFQTFPGGDGGHDITVVQRGDEFHNQDFGFRAEPGTVSGVKYNDLNGNGFFDADESGVSGVFVFADLDRNGTLAYGEPADITDANGNYTLVGLPASALHIREVLPFGWQQTEPGFEGYHLVLVSPGEVIEDINFGNQRAADFGDAPAPYPTLEADGGALHGIREDFHLGALFDTEADGLPNSDASGDDRNNANDEDGVLFTTPLFAGLTATAQVTVTNGNNSAGALQGWIDFNADGDWNDFGEQVVTDLVLAEGIHTVSIDVPAGAIVGTTFARFRYGYERSGDIGPTGSAMAGEVEDYQVIVLNDEPQANDDNRIVDQDSVNNQLDVLRNDFPSSQGGLRINSVGPTDRGGFVTVAPGGQRLIYSPATNFFSPPVETFTYQIIDNSGETDTATVTVTVAPTFVDPIAVDDTVRVQAGSVNNVIEVLINDIAGTNGPLTIISTTDPSTGSVQIAGNTIRYTPSDEFADVDQFEYTVSNQTGDLEQAQVTIFEEPEGDKDVRIYVEPVNENGDILTQVGVGQQFFLRVSIQDLRNVSSLLAGMGTAYLDVGYDRNLVSVNADSDNDLGFQIAFSNKYDQVVSGIALVPGIIDEVGALQGDFVPLGKDKLTVFIVGMTANAPGTVEFVGDPADISPNHDILYFQPPEPAELADISYGFSQLAILPNGTSGTGNTGGDPQPSDYDVNGDGILSPIDVLLILNHLNGSTTGSGEGEGPDLSRMDINRDSRITPIDALILINELNGRAGGALGEGEAIVDAAPAVLLESNRAESLAEATAPARLQNFGRDYYDITNDYSVRIGTAESSEAAHREALEQDDLLDGLLDDLAMDIIDGWS